MTEPTHGAVEFPRVQWRIPGDAKDGYRSIAEETAVAIVHDGSTTAVMMATPADIEDLAIGFSLTEGLVNGIADIRGVNVVESELGIEARVWLRPGLASGLAERRRSIVGPTGCGLCGIDSLVQAVRPAGSVQTRSLTVGARDLVDAMSRLTGVQRLGPVTRAVHAAAFWTPEGITQMREDVGRHNALDKLVGAMARAGEFPEGAVLVTSRVSIELVQKAIRLGAGIVCAVSAPTSLAIRTADMAGMTLVGIARADGLEVFTHAQRIRMV